MNRSDRLLAILLHLRGGRETSASALARRFEVSVRTIYRDMEALGEIGVPIYARPGRAGGFGLMDGFFLPPVMFTAGEAASLVLGLASLRAMRYKPFAAELDSAERKLLAALPNHLRAVLDDAATLIGFEELPRDLLHPEPDDAPAAAPAPGDPAAAAIDVFLRAILAGTAVRLRYRSPYRGRTHDLLAAPWGVFWDRDRWYVVGGVVGGPPEPRLWRVDRVLEARPSPERIERPAGFDVRDLLGHRWLAPAIRQWMSEAPVRIRVTSGQAALLRRDWYYRHAQFEPVADDGYLVTLGEDNRQVVFDLLRWLGPGAELIEPVAWRAALREELTRMLATYQAGDAG